MNATASEVAKAAQVAHPDAKLATAEAELRVFEEIYGAADFTESFAACLKEAARRGDRVRAHGYIVDIVRCGKELAEEYGRISALAKLGGQQ